VTPGTASLILTPFAPTVTNGEEVAENRRAGSMLAMRRLRSRRR
jgi:hypothetical protein